jgi:hypothetical protein
MLAILRSKFTHNEQAREPLIATGEVESRARRPAGATHPFSRQRVPSVTDRDPSLSTHAAAASARSPLRLAGAHLRCARALQPNFSTPARSRSPRNSVSDAAALRG